MNLTAENTAVVLDSTTLDIDEVVARLVALLRQKVGHGTLS